jgi:hypothetical protein
MKSNALDAMAKPTYLNPFKWYWHIFLTIQNVFFFNFRIFQIGKNCHGASPWENGRQTLLQFFGISQIQIM